MVDLDQLSYQVWEKLNISPAGSYVVVEEVMHLSALLLYFSFNSIFIKRPEDGIHPFYIQVKLGCIQ